MSTFVWCNGNPDEQHALIGTFLIKVTQFFRDADLYRELRERVLPDIVAMARKRDQTIRLWSAGCATGEEAYSLAILLAEVLGDELEQFHVRIFATDLDDSAIGFARQGLYPEGRLSGIEPGFLERHFELADGGYQISKRIRALMVFGQHDLAQRAAFPRVDLILCRNVLIYFTPDLQRRILQLFAFSLRGGGYLILGKSETTTPFADGYAVDDQRLKIYRRRADQIVIPTGAIPGATPLTSPRVPIPRPSVHRAVQSPHSAPPSREGTVPVRADSILLDLPTGVVVVDRRYDIQYINDSARSLLSIHGSALGEDLIHLADAAAGSELRGLIDRAFAGEVPISGTLSAEDNATGRTRYVRVAAAVTRSSNPPLVILCLWDITVDVDERSRLEAEVAEARQGRERAEQQRGHLAATNEELLTVNQQITREFAELRSQNEEFLVGNEELQAAGEEVETLNEELQATNEELETLNEELQATVEELNTTNDDLQNRNLEIQELAMNVEGARIRLTAVLDSLTEAVAVVNPQGQTVLTNARYASEFAGPLDTVDVLDESGRQQREEERPHRRGARGERFESRFAVRTASGTLRVYAVTGQPIQDASDEVAGVVLIRRADDAATNSP